MVVCIESIKVNFIKEIPLTSALFIQNLRTYFKINKIDSSRDVNKLQKEET